MDIVQEIWNNLSQIISLDSLLPQDKTDYEQPCSRFKMSFFYLSTYTITKFLVWACYITFITTNAIGVCLTGLFFQRSLLV